MKWMLIKDQEHCDVTAESPNNGARGRRPLMSNG
jgi:hypothetical protein